MKHFIQVLIFISFNLTINAQHHSWVRTNPGGGGAFSTIGASKSGIIIAGSDLSGAYRSLNGGKSWDVIGANKGLLETHVSGVGFDRIDGDILYIGTEGGIYRSDDGGESVKLVLDEGYITDIEFATNDPNIGYATFHPWYNAKNGSIYKTTDRGLSWDNISEDLPNGLRLLKMMVHPTNPDIVYVLSGNGRFSCGSADLFKSIDGGEKWVNTTTNIKSVLDFSFHTNNPDKIYITTMNANCSEPYYWTDLEGAIYESEDGGDHWSTALSDYTGVIWLNEKSPATLRLIDPRQPYPWIDRAGTFTSKDSGKTFTKTGDVEDWDTFYQGHPYFAYGSSFNGICKTLGEDLSNPNKLLWVNSQWVFETTDGGTTFNNLMTEETKDGNWRSTGFDNVNMSDISISSSYFTGRKTVIYAAYFDIGIWKSTDYGYSWSSCNDSLFTGNWEGKGGNCATILADPNTSNKVWASLSPNQDGEDPTYLIKSLKSGDKNSWKLSNSGLPQKDINGLSLDPNSPKNNRTLYVTADKDVYKSTDDGMNWLKALDCDGCRFTAVDQYDGNIVYAGGENGIWRSTDGGMSWEDISTNEMKSTKGFWDGDYDGIFCVETHPDHSNWVYTTVLGEGKGLYESKDGGENWDHILKDEFMRKMAILPRERGQYMYATSSSAFEAGGYDSNSKGILYSEDYGVTWSQPIDEMAYPFGLAIDFMVDVIAWVFVGSPGTGFQRARVPISVNSEDYNESNSSIKMDKIAVDVYQISGYIEGATIELIDANGRIIKIYNAKGSNQIIDLIGLASGGYYVQVNTIKSVPIINFKLIKK